MGAGSSSHAFKYQMVHQLEQETHFKRSEIEALHQRFLKLASKSDDTYVIQRSQFAEVLSSVVQHSAQEDLLERLWDAWDANEADTINFKEFCVGLSIVSRGTLRERIHLAFNMFNTKESGEITKGEMKSVLLLLNKTADEIDLLHYPVNLRESQIRRMSQEEQISQFVELSFAEYDKDGNGTLSYEEWESAVLHSSVFKELEERLSLKKL